MQLHQLRYIITLAEERQFVRAAARLHLAQPSISSAVRALERELGVTLFDRARGGVTLTAAGETFLPWARQVMADCDAGVAAVEELTGLQRGRVTVGATPSLTTTLIPEVIAAFRRDHPRIDLTLVEAGSGDLVEGLEGSVVDFAVVILPMSRSWVESKALGDEELVVAVPDGHDLAGRRHLELVELRDVPVVMFREGYDLRESTVGACHAAGFAPIFAIEGLEMDGVLAMTAAGVGASVVPASVIPSNGRLHTIRFAHRELVRTIGVAFRRDRTLSTAAATLMTRLEANIRAALGPQAGSANLGERFSK